MNQIDEYVKCIEQLETLVAKQGHIIEDGEKVMAEQDKLISAHEELISELEKVVAELKQRLGEPPEPEPNTNYLEQRIAANLKEQEGVDSIDGRRVKAIAKRMLIEMDRRADAARKRLKERGFPPSPA